MRNAESGMRNQECHSSFSIRHSAFLILLFLTFTLFSALRLTASESYDIFYTAPYLVEPDTTKVVYPIPVPTGDPMQDLYNQSPSTSATPTISPPKSSTTRSPDSTPSSAASASSTTTPPPRFQKANSLITRTKKAYNNTGRSAAAKTPVPPPTAIPSSRPSTSAARPLRPSSAATPSTSARRVPSTSPSASSTATATTLR